MMKYVYEFIGTFFLVFTIGMVSLIPAAGPLAPLAIGSVLAVMIYAGAHISGGHYNPAVSFSVFLRGRLSAESFGFYCIAQVLGAIIAALLVMYFLVTPPEPLLALDIPRALLAEFLFTFALCFVVLNVATARETAGNSYFGFAIGFTVLAGAYAVGVVAGGAFNPAVAIGIMLLNLVSWSSIWIYIVANLLGAAAAAYVFRAAHPSEVATQNEVKQNEMRK